jgi:hypothetical protein
MKLSSAITYFLLFSFCFNTSYSQPSSYAIAITRQYVHYNLDKQQKQLLALDGKADEELRGSADAEVNLQITYAATQKIDALQREIELDTTIDNNLKITYLRGLGEVLSAYGDAVRQRKLKILHLPDVIQAWRAGYTADKGKQSLVPVINNYSHAVGTVILKGISFMHNPGLPDARNRLIMKFIEENPKQLLATLANSPDVPFADSLIEVTAAKDPGGLFTYAQASSTKFGKRIQRHPNETVKLLVALAGDNSGQLCLPFFDNIKRGVITTTEIKKAARDSVAYFKLLVKTQIDYAGRAAKGDTPAVWNKLTAMLHDKAYQPFINTVNELHDASSLDIRFRILKPMGPQELYYLAIVCEPEIYTSSYVNIFKMIWQRMENPNADTLLAMVNEDHYKKFISMAANYNTLDEFLSKMSKEHATTLMTRFVNNLENTGDLEDAVDVASSYASIKNPEIKKLMLDQISKNYDRSLKGDDENAKIIYRLEKLILESSDSASTINLSDSLGILPVYDVTNNFLKDSAGRIVLQMFFYGDNTGRGSYNVLRNLYSNAAWKRTDKPEWTQFTSVNSPVPFIIFANRPGDENKNEDAIAQQHLAEWMDENGYEPTITVHRGHSYSLKYTVKQLPPTSKVIILGSCGAYHTMDDILSRCPDAYLVASKQTGYGAINVPLFSNMIDHLKKGNDSLKITSRLIKTWAPLLLTPIKKPGRKWRIKLLHIQVYLK